MCQSVTESLSGRRYVSAPRSRFFSLSFFRRFGLRRPRPRISRCVLCGPVDTAVVHTSTEETARKMSKPKVYVVGVGMTKVKQNREFRFRSFRLCAAFFQSPGTFSCSFSNHDQTDIVVGSAFLFSRFSCAIGCSTGARASSRHAVRVKRGCGDRNLDRPRARRFLLQKLGTPKPRASRSPANRFLKPCPFNSLVWVEGAGGVASLG